MEITVDQMYQIENKGHDMGFLFWNDFLVNYGNYCRSNVSDRK
jgi:hypothetical protein